MLSIEGGRAILRFSLTFDLDAVTLAVNVDTRAAGERLIRTNAICGENKLNPSYPNTSRYFFEDIKYPQKTLCIEHCVTSQGDRHCKIVYLAFLSSLPKKYEGEQQSSKTFILSLTNGD